jgi:hypothetical protein
MFGLLDAILCYIKQLAALIADGGVWLLNLVIAAVATVVTGILSLLPGMPTLPTMPTYMTTGIAWIGEFWPIGTTIDILAFLVAYYLVWLIVGMVLRWAKVLS